MKKNRIRIDFASGARRVAWQAFLFPGLAFMALAVGSLEIEKVLTSHAELAEQLASLETRRPSGAPAALRSTPSSKGELTQTRAIRQVAQKLVTPWSDLLQSLESTPSRAVALLAVEPSASKRTLRLTAEARTLPDMLAYLGALQRDARLSSVVLVSHQIQTQVPGSPVRFQIQAHWGGEP